MAAHVARAALEVAVGALGGGPSSRGHGLAIGNVLTI